MLCPCYLSILLGYSYTLILKIVYYEGVDKESQMSTLTPEQRTKIIEAGLLIDSVRIDLIPDDPNYESPEEQDLGVIYSNIHNFIYQNE